MNPVILTWEDICQHTPHCVSTKLLESTVPNHRTYVRAVDWLMNVRNQKAVSVRGVHDERGHTGAYTFRFFCEHEYVLFVLRWGGHD